MLQVKEAETAFDVFKGLFAEPPSAEVEALQ